MKLHKLHKTIGLYRRKMRTIIQQAFDNTDTRYMSKSLEQRNPGTESAGSTFDSHTTFEDLKFGRWEPANDPAIQAPGLGFVSTQFGGTLGITEINSLPMEQTVVLQPAHKGQAKIRTGPDAGKCPAECAATLSTSQLKKVDFTTLIVGPSRDDADKMTVWTFFPGPATFKFKEIPFEDLQEKYGTNEKQIRVTVAEAIGLGYKFVKNVGEL